MRLLIRRRGRNGEAGFTLVEILASFLLISVMSLAIAKNTISALRAAKFTEVNHAASSLAISKVEELTAINTADLDETFSGTENEVSWSTLNITFTRQTTVTVNPDNSRLIEVEVTSNAALLPTTVTFDTTVVPWE